MIPTQGSLNINDPIRAKVRRAIIQHKHSLLNIRLSLADILRIVKQLGDSHMLEKGD
jgi:hypothetical protein